MCVCACMCGVLETEIEGQVFHRLPYVVPAAESWVGACMGTKPFSTQRKSESCLPIYHHRYKAIPERFFCCGGMHSMCSCYVH